SPVSSLFWSYADGHPSVYDARRSPTFVDSVVLQSVDVAADLVMEVMSPRTERDANSELLIDTTEVVDASGEVLSSQGGLET
ncbi:hypothetical protein HPB47_015580, partial [Ixodes persulcatus]